MDNQQCLVYTETLNNWLDLNGFSEKCKDSDFDCVFEMDLSSLRDAFSVAFEAGIRICRD